MQVPTWLMAIMFAALFVAILGGVFWLVNHNSQAPVATVETPASAQPAPGGPNPVQKYIEITGLRFAPATKGSTVTFVVINHSTADLVGLSGTAKIMGMAQRSDETPVATFTFQLSMPAASSKELTMPVDTKLKAAALPDWHDVRVDVQITSPTTI